MGKKKEHCIVSANLGTPGEPARAFYEAFVKQHGKQAWSKYIRSVIGARAMGNPKFEIERLFYELKDTTQMIMDAVDKKKKLEAALLKHGVAQDQIDNFTLKIVE